MASAGGMKSKPDFRKAKELEEARKAGTAPAEKDEEGNDINPHIPQYISQAPWYLNQTHAGLKHQRGKAQEKSDVNMWYKKGKDTIAGPAATKFRKGACQNCGAMTHKAKDCLERPRKVGAKFTGKDIRPDEVVQGDLGLDYDGKRDNWANYDTTLHAAVVDQFQKTEEARKDMKRQEMDKKKANVDEEADFIEKDDDTAQMQKLDTGSRTSVRNLRIREDTAKYLRNLDVNSAYYDPKTRSMRDNPTPNKNPDEQLYAGDNFYRYTGEAAEIQQQQMFAWDAADKGTDVHMQAIPSQAEKAFSEFKKKKDLLKGKHKSEVLEKYGGEQHMEAPPPELLLGQTEAYTEYDRTGRVVKGQEKAAVRSKYTEDQLDNNHTHIWGSYWSNGRWGYACCSSTTRNSYCTGSAGKQAAEAAQQLMMRNTERAAERQSLKEQYEKYSEEQKAKDEEKKELEKRAKFKAALEREEKMAKADVETDERKRKYNSFASDNVDVTEEDMEAYRLKRLAREDPMADMIANGKKDEKYDYV